MKVLLALCLIVFLEVANGYSFPTTDINKELQEYKSSAKSLLHKYKNNPKTAAQCQVELLPILSQLVGLNCSYDYFAMNISNSSRPNMYNFSDATAARDAMCARCNVPALRTTLEGTTYCVGNEDSFMVTRFLLDFAALGCHKTGSTYCFDSLFGDNDDNNNNNNNGDSNTPPTQAELSTICTDSCFDTVATFIQTQAPCLAPFQFLTIVCLQDTAGTYCAEAMIGIQNQYLNYSEEVITTTQVDAFNRELQPFCLSCGSELYASWFTTKANEISTCPGGAYGASGPGANFYGLMCDVDATGSLCLPIIRETNLSGNNRNFSDCPRTGPPSNWTGCGSTTGCQSAMQELATTFDCCYNSLLELYHGYGEVAAGKLWAETQCNTKTNPICQSLVEIQGEGYQANPSVVLSVLAAASVFMLMF